MSVAFSGWLRDRIEASGEGDPDPGVRMYKGTEV